MMASSGIPQTSTHLCAFCVYTVGMKCKSLKLAIYITHYFKSSNLIFKDLLKHTYLGLKFFFLSLLPACFLPSFLLPLPFSFPSPSFPSLPLLPLPLPFFPFPSLFPDAGDRILGFVYPRCSCHGTAEIEEQNWFIRMPYSLWPK